MRMRIKEDEEKKKKKKKIFFSSFYLVVNKKELPLLFCPNTSCFFASIPSNEKNEIEYSKYRNIYKRQQHQQQQQLMKIVDVSLKIRQ